MSSGPLLQPLFTDNSKGTNWLSQCASPTPHQNYSVCLAEAKNEVVILKVNVYVKEYSQKKMYAM